MFSCFSLVPSYNKDVHVNRNSPWSVIIEFSLKYSKRFFKSAKHFPNLSFRYKGIVSVVAS
jgi:hypothetical protein